MQAFFGRKSTRVFITICMITCYGNRCGVVPHCFCKRLRSYVLTCPQRFNSPGGGVAAGGSLRSSLSGSRPTSHSQGHGRPCLPRPHLRPCFTETNGNFLEEDVKGDSAPVSCLRKFPIRPNERFAYWCDFLLRNGIEELGHAGSEGFAGELADGVSLVVFGENLVQFGLSGVLHLDIFLVVGSIELVPAHIDI